MLFIKHTLSWAWKLMPVTLALWRLRQEDHHEFKTNLNHMKKELYTLTKTLEKTFMSTKD